MPNARSSISLLPVLLASAMASADSVEVTYEIQPSSTVGASVPGLGGSYTLRFSATGLHTLAAGPATLLSFAATQAGAPYPFATRGLVGAPGSYPETLFVPTGYGGGATITGGVASVAAVITTFGQRRDLAFWNVTGNLTFLTSGTFFGYPNYGIRASIVGQEVSRTFMPEPSGEWVLPASSMVVGALAWTRRRRA